MGGGGGETNTVSEFSFHQHALVSAESSHDILQRVGSTTTNAGSILPRWSKTQRSWVALFVQHVRHNSMNRHSE